MLTVILLTVAVCYLLMGLFVVVCFAIGRGIPNGWGEWGFALALIFIFPLVVFDAIVYPPFE